MLMKVLTKTLAIATGMALATSAYAQTATHRVTTVKTTQTTSEPALHGNANSFTETQARNRIAKAGYTKVSALQKGDDGIWRGTANRKGHVVHVGLDYKGNVSVANH